DRHEEIRLFSSYLSQDPPREKILFFHGDAGNGKSVLLRALRKQMEGTESVPSAFLDFGMKPEDDNRPQESFSGLAMLWRTLAAHGLHFPLYGFACISYLQKTKTLTRDRVRNIFPAEEMDFLIAIVDAIFEGGLGTLAKAALTVFGKHLRLSESFTLYMQRRKVSQKEIEDIEKMNAERELIGNLPRLFAKDLNAAMGSDTAPNRVVLFFDTHEAFWGQGRDLSDHLFFEKDEWLRQLLINLDPASGIVAVVAGREPPRWAEDWIPFRVPEERIDAQLVGYLPDADADKYLQNAGIVDTSMRQCLIAYARAKPAQVHPYLLGLCADVVLAALAKGILTPDDFRLGDLDQKAKRLVRCLLSYVDKEIQRAVEALSACRAFNETIYFTLGESLKFRATTAGFEVLTGFSFVENLGHGSYRFNNLLRRFMHELKYEVTSKADGVLENYYRTQGEAGDISAVAEAIYHANRLDWKRGATDWVKTFERALNLSRFDLCRALLVLRMEFSIRGELERGQIARCAADYFASL
ncbi:MAG: hypothetical protein MN733_44295, partial [Nitrososphaera sp.]|nr:hypothetical protein [Nitrososphaera sp.]